MNKKTASIVLAEVQTYVGDNNPNYGPMLMDHNHEELPEGSWSICYEGGMDEWALNFALGGSQVSGVHIEAINSCIIAIYDA